MASLGGLQHCRQAFAPDQPHPLHDVVGQAGPKRLDSHLRQASQAKLPDPEFLLDPGVRRFSHLTSPSLHLLGRIGRHLGPHRRHLFGFLDQHRHRPALFQSLRTTLLAKVALAAYTAGRLINRIAVAALLIVPYQLQPLALRTDQSRPWRRLVKPVARKLLGNP